MCCVNRMHLSVVGFVMEWKMLWCSCADTNSYATRTMDAFIGQAPMHPSILFLHYPSTDGDIIVHSPSVSMVHCILFHTNHTILRSYSSPRSYTVSL